MSLDAEERAAAYRAEQSEIARLRDLILRRLDAPPGPYADLVERYQPIKDYQEEIRGHGRAEEQPKDNGVTVN